MTADTNSAVRHETRDVNARALALIVLGGCVGATLVFLAMAALFGVYRAAEDSADSPPSPLMTPESTRPAEPHLEVDTARSLQALRQAQQERLQSYGWVDRKAETVRVPLERAIDRIVEHGLPDWPEQKTNPAKVETEHRP